MSPRPAILKSLDAIANDAFVVLNNQTATATDFFTTQKVFF